MDSLNTPTRIPNKYAHLRGTLALTALSLFTQASFADQEERMDKLWGESDIVFEADNTERGKLFKHGNYAMFIHWGLYSEIANKYRGETYYGIGEWIMSRRMADIPPEEYLTVADRFNPTEFDPKAIAKLAKDAGMKYIVITAKHHDGFAMYDSAVSENDIVDATPYGKDPMLDLANACRAEGLGFGFYYSHTKDWTAPGGSGGPSEDADGRKVSFDEYFETKCLPQVIEITQNYGPLELIWFDTPGRIPKKHVQALIDVVRKNQPNALINSRVGAQQGDYRCLGDMEVPRANIRGLWETVDTSNDSWSYAWYDENWKSPKEIASRVVSTVARGGTYMLNVGPDGLGAIPERLQETLRASGEWIQRYPFVVYNADASPWGKALPWGDITVNKNSLFLSVFNMPRDRVLRLPNLKTDIASVSLFEGRKQIPLKFKKQDGWTLISLPSEITEPMIPVIEVALKSAPEVETTRGIDPSVPTTLLTEFAKVDGAKLEKNRWMEKFGEWKAAYRAFDWTENGTASWEVDVLEPGYYQTNLTYSGEGRIVWRVSVEGGDEIQNQQNSSHNFQEFPIGWLNFPKPGRYQVSVSCIDGDMSKASLKALHLNKVVF